MVADNNNQDWVNVIPSYYKCPHCAKGKLDTRIKRGFFVRNLFVWMDVKRYQCNTCERKVYVKNHSHDDAISKFKIS